MAARTAMTTTRGPRAAALGPIDVMAWGAAVLGIALGLVVLVAFLQAVG